MIPVTAAIDDAEGGARSTSGATVGAPGNYTISADATRRVTEISSGPAIAALAPAPVIGYQAPGLPL